jgi:8-oxo-dGTP diphosphatase
MSPLPGTIEVTCAVIIRDNRVLAARRGPGSQAGLWEFPGGKLNPGENEIAGLTREIAEELNIAIEPVQRLPVSEHAYHDKHITLIPYLCRWISGKIEPAEHSEVQWCTPGELKSLEWSAADLPVVRWVGERLRGLSF